MSIMNECSKVKTWMENAEKVQNTLKKHQDPPITVAEVQKMGTELVNVRISNSNFLVKRLYRNANRL